MMVGVGSVKKQRYKAYEVYYNYHHYFYHYFYNHLWGTLVKRGRKLWAFNFLVSVRGALKDKEQISPHILLLISFSKISPLVILYPLKLGAVIYKVPRPISLKKQRMLSLRWLVKSLREGKKTKAISVDELVLNILSSISHSGLAMEKKKQEHLFSGVNRHLIRRFKS